MVRLLLVPLWHYNWRTRESVENTEEIIYSPSSAECPASKSAGYSDKDGEKGWQVVKKDGKIGTVDITVTCLSHSYMEKVDHLCMSTDTLVWNLTTDYWWGEKSRFFLLFCLCGAVRASDNH